MAILEVVQVVLGDQVDVMLLRVVPLWVRLLSDAILSSVLLVRLVLELINDIAIFAKLSWESSGFLDIDTEVELFVEQLLCIFDL